VRIRITPLGIVATGLMCVTLAAAPALADWPNDNPTKWVQLPDREHGLDVLATFPYPSPTPVDFGKILADDFLCTFSGPITDIHIWGSWLNDQVPLLPGQTGQLVPAPTAAKVKLSIHADIPVGPTAPYSRPGAELWSYIFDPFTYVARIDGQGTELFYDPNLGGRIIGTDTQIWQYNFVIPQHEAFRQTAGTVYWLDVQVAPVWDPTLQQEMPLFGWKTSFQHWNDDAVFADTNGFAGPLIGSWQELRYPQHPAIPEHLWGQSIDLAFALTTIPLPAALPAGAVLFAGMFGAAYIRRLRRKAI